MSRLFSSLYSADYLRRPVETVDRRSGFWEWVHFAVRSPGVDLIVNFCTASDPREEVPPGTWLASWMVAARDGRGWLGDVETFDREAVALGMGRIFAEAGGNRISLENGVYRIQGRLRRMPVAFELALVPAAMPVAASLGAGLSWFVVPRLAAWGTVDMDGRRRSFQGEPAYCDHNWGPVGGADLAWEWGYLHARARSQPGSVLFVRLLDKARLATRMQGLFVWRDGVPEVVLRDRQIHVARSEGVSRSLQTIPGVCSLLLPSRSAEVPAGFAVDGEGRTGDRLSLSFRPGEAVRIAVPDGPGEELIIIHESTGRGVLRGQMQGQPFEVEGDGFFEFVTR